MTDVSPITDERLAEIRAGLVGCTPGPWMLEIETSEHVDESEEDRQPEVYVCSSDTCCDYTVVATMGRAEAIRHDRKSRDASHIARLDPQTVSALLARLDKAEALMLDLRAFIVATADDLSMHSKAVALSDRVTNHFPPPPSSES